MLFVCFFVSFCVLRVWYDSFVLLRLLGVVVSWFCVFLVFTAFVCFFWLSASVAFCVFAMLALFCAFEVR